MLNFFYLWKKKWVKFLLIYSEILFLYKFRKNLIESKFQKESRQKSLFLFYFKLEFKKNEYCYSKRK